MFVCLIVCVICFHVCACVCVCAWCIQGQEERVIIISTTLSNSERLTKENDDSLGFLSNTRRSYLIICVCLSVCLSVYNITVYVQVVLNNTTKV